MSGSGKRELFRRIHPSRAEPQQGVGHFHAAGISALAAACCITSGRGFARRELFGLRCGQGQDATARAEGESKTIRSAMPSAIRTRPPVLYACRDSRDDRCDR